MDHNDFSSSIDIDSLTDTQKKAVFHREGPLFVLAGPGSGKTRVITSRIAYLITSGVRPYNICAITFTNKAAEEMRQRIASTNAAPGVHISTFHSLCVRILRRYGQRANISTNFSIYDTTEQKNCMKEAVKSCRFDTTNFTPAKMLDAVSKCKNDLEDVESLKNRSDDYFTNVLVKIYAAYQKFLKNNNALDFDDLLLQTAFLLRDHPDVRSELSDHFKYLLIDEYQDTNHAQYQIAKGLALAHGNICVTGDPDQSIYRWRGADIKNILIFEKDWPSAAVVKLEENFRSTPNILAMADKLISFNKKRKQKTLIATRPPGPDAVIETCDDETIESETVAEKVKQLIAAGTDLNEIAVFYRVNSMSRPIEEAFVLQQIPYQIVRGVEFYSRKEIRDMLSYLKLIVNPDDDVAFTRAVNTHPRGIGKTTLERLARYASDNMLNLYNAAAAASHIESIAKQTRAKLTAFTHAVETLKIAAAGPVAPLMDRVFTETGLLDNLKAGGEKQQSAIENINELINAAAKYDRQAQEPNLLEYLQAIALYSDTDAYDPQAGKVSLMTLHAAKGLEFDNAFIIGLEEGILPHERSSQSEDELEEERRLFFVGITRAKTNLHISYAKHRMLRGQYLRTMPSAFLYEIDFNPYDSVFEDDDFKDNFNDNDTDQDTEIFAPGQLVEHQKFGIGRVKEFLNLGPDSIVVVKFNSGKTKSLMIKYANLTKPL